jgi:hypothetical protein
MKPRIYADFNKLDENRSAILVCLGTKIDLDKLGLTLQEGMEVTLYQPDEVDENGLPDDLEVDAVIAFHKELKCWVGRFIWEDLSYRSEKGKSK